MGDIIIEKLCNFCKNKSENCLCYIVSENKNTTTYKCTNYIKNEYKIKGYNEKWIDNVVSDIIGRRTRKGRTL